MNSTTRVSYSQDREASRRTSVLLSEDLSEIDGVVDARFPGFRFERKGRRDTLRDGRELKEVSSDDELYRPSQLPSHTKNSRTHLDSSKVRLLSESTRNRSEFVEQETIHHRDCDDESVRNPD